MRAGSVRDMAELRVRFHESMRGIEAKVIQLFALVAEDLAGATDAVLSGDTEQLKVLIEREETIDALYAEVDELVNQHMALQAPVAADLRYLLSVMRIVPELERSHDLVVHIARRSNHFLLDDLSPRTRGLVQKMGDLGVRMWRSAADAWYERNGLLALSLDEFDDEMDELHSTLMAELATGRMTLPVTMEMTLVARFYERLGDHSVNIARRVTYLAGPAPEGA